MIIFGEVGVKYFSTTQQNWIWAYRGQDIPQADYDAMPPMERYWVLCHFVGEGDEPKRITYHVD